MHWHTGTYRHAHMHKLTHALECATASACPHASACAHARMHYTHACTTHTQTHINTLHKHSLSLSLSLSLTHTHTHTQHTHVNKHCICAHTRILTQILAHVQALGKLPTGVGAGMTIIILERVWGYPVLVFMNLGSGVSTVRYGNTRFSQGCFKDNGIAVAACEVAACGLYHHIQILYCYVSFKVGV